MPASILESPVCACGHVLAVHDPCSICHCPAFKPSKKRVKYAPRKKAER